jgi:uncharacterized membrane protein
VTKVHLESFSDAVFAIAATVLVLGIAPPVLSASEHGMQSALLALWPKLLAYALSFGVIGIMWQNHHALFSHVEKIDRTTVSVNLLILGTAAFIPFVTALLGTYPAMHATTFFYGLVLTSLSLCYTILVHRLVRTGALSPDTSPATIAATVRACHVGLVGYACATLVALILPVVSFAAYIAFALYYLVQREAA